MPRQVQLDDVLEMSELERFAENVDLAAAIAFVGNNMGTHKVCSLCTSLYYVASFLVYNAVVHCIVLRAALLIILIATTVYFNALFVQTDYDNMITNTLDSASTYHQAWERFAVADRKR